jgi:hypothetical protein
MCMAYIYSFHLCTYICTTVSGWCHVIDTGLTTSNGKTVRNVLINIMQTFPSYDLETDEGICKAIKDTRTQFGELANIEECSKLLENIL